MENLQSLLHGFTIAVTVPHLTLMVIGVLLGILVGVLPGLGAPNGVSLLLPLTFGMQPVSAIILLSSMYWGALFGGSVTSILFNIPGEPSSVATTFDGIRWRATAGRRRRWPPPSARRRSARWLA
jgi:putative tricarboxylic transport membrane protein